MSIRAGRVFLLIAGAVFIASMAWIWTVWTGEDPWSGATTVPAILGLVSLVCLVSGPPLFSRFVEAAMDRERITVRYVLGPSRSVPVSDVDEVVLLQQLCLPSRTGTSSRPRVLLRRNNVTTLAFTPRNTDIVHTLASRGVHSTVVTEALTPYQASRRYRGTVSSGELISGAMVWIAVAIPAVVVALMMWRALES